MMYQKLARVFDHISKHWERKLKNEVQPIFLARVCFELFGNCDQALIRVFDILLEEHDSRRAKVIIRSKVRLFV